MVVMDEAFDEAMPKIVEKDLVKALEVVELVAITIG